MSEQKTDRRIIRTKRVIRDALADLIEEKGFERVTVRDLTEKADINRGTFYLHYQDKYDLLAKSEKEIIEQMRDLLTKLNPDLTFESDLASEPIRILAELFEYIQGNGRFMRLILGPKGDPSFQVMLKQFMKENFLRKVMSKSNENKLLVPLDPLIEYVSSAHLGVIQHWLDKGMQESPKEMAVLLAKITFYGPARVAGLKKE